MQKILSAAILPALALSACATPATPPIADSSCAIFRAISYAIPRAQPDGTRNMPEDPGNRYDTPETVTEIQIHNTRFTAICPTP